MYEDTLSNPFQSSFVFKIPHDTDAGYSMLTMSRLNFVEPIFPNITSESKQKMAQKYSNGLVLKDVQNFNYSNQDEWSALGLEGWSGVISSIQGQKQSIKE